MSSNKCINISETSSGSLVSCINFGTSNTAFIDFGIGTDLNLLNYTDLAAIKIPVKDLKEHLLDLLSTIHLYENGFYNEN